MEGKAIQYNFIAKCQYTDCTRCVLWCQVYSFTPTIKHLITTTANKHPGKITKKSLSAHTIHSHKKQGWDKCTNMQRAQHRVAIYQRHLELTQSQSIQFSTEQVSYKFTTVVLL